MNSLRKQLSYFFKNPTLEKISFITGIISSLLSLYFILAHLFPINPKNPASILLKQTARWTLASEQDKNPLIAVLHANYAAGYLYALRDIMSDKDIENVTNVSVMKIQHRVQQVQQDATMRALRYCPNFSTQLNDELSLLGGESL